MGVILRYFTKLPRHPLQVEGELTSELAIINYFLFYISGKAKFKILKQRKKSYFGEHKFVDIFCRIQSNIFD